MDALRADIESQPDALAAFGRSRISKASRGAIFVGAGDSYAAALAGFYASKGRCIALDPYSLASEPEVSEGVDVYFISVSGKTASNVASARRVKDLARSTSALTAAEGSPLAGLVDRVIPLPMRYAPRTAGMLSFTLSLLAVLKLCGWKGTPDFKGAMRSAKEDRECLRFGGGTTYMLGNSLGYVSALYTAAKAYELLGAKAHAELIEEFSHLEMFSLAKEDEVDVFSCFDPLGIAGRLAKTIRESGYASSLIPSRGRTDVERLFHSVFVGQLATLKGAVDAGLREPNFLASGRRLRASDSMIY